MSNKFQNTIIDRLKENDLEYEVVPIDTIFSPNGVARFRTYFGRVLRGQSIVYETPFAKGESVKDMLDGWGGILVKGASRWPSLLKFEEDMRAKVGPMSVQVPWAERISDLAAYYHRNPGVGSNRVRIDSEAFASLESKFRGLHGLRLRSWNETVDRMKKSTNSGTPFFTTRNEVVQDTLDLLSGNGARDYTMCAVPGWRGQEGGPLEQDVKQRMVWMFPFSLNVLELSFYQPFIQGCQALDIVPAWVSMDNVDKRITTLFEYKKPSDVVVCTDFTKFDQSFRGSLAAVSYKLYSMLGHERSLLRWLDHVWPQKYQIPMVVYGDGRNAIIATGAHGMASGSGGTNCDETVAHMYLQLHAAHRAGTRLNPGSTCLGDDGVLTYPGITVESVTDAYSSHGLQLNPTKQYASLHDCVFLRRWYADDYTIDGICRGVYSTFRALGRLRYLERFMNPEYWGVQAVALRQLSIIENTKWHPLFEEFVNYCIRRDKYRLGLDIPHFLDKIEPIARDLTAKMPDLIGYTKTLQSDSVSGIGSWRVVQYLKSLG